MIGVVLDNSFFFVENKYLFLKLLDQGAKALLQHNKGLK